MKKNYQAPEVEVVKFEYKDQVVAASGCYYQRGNTLYSSTSECEGIIGQTNAM